MILSNKQALKRLTYVGLSLASISVPLDTKASSNSSTDSTEQSFSGRPIKVFPVKKEIVEGYEKAPRFREDDNPISYIKKIFGIENRTQVERDLQRPAYDLANEEAGERTRASVNNHTKRNIHNNKKTHSCPSTDNIVDNAKKLNEKKKQDYLKTKNTQNSINVFGSKLLTKLVD
jgi:hypothetical protein